MDFADSGIEEHAQSIERSHKMLKLVESSVELLRRKHKHGEDYYWLLYYSFLSPQQYRSADEIIEQLKPHIRDAPITGNAGKPLTPYPQSCGAIPPRTAYRF